MIENAPIEAADFFVLRVPSAPYSSLASIREAYEADGGILSSALAQSPMAREAIYLASSSLFGKLYEEGVETKKLTLSLAKYLFRMATRCTPYGVFAGVARGIVGDATQLNIDNVPSGRRVARIDQGVIAGLQARLLQSNVDMDLLRNLSVVANSSLWRAPDGYRYVEAMRGGAWTHYELSRVALTEPIQWVLDSVGAGGAEFSVLARGLGDRFEQDVASAEAFLKALVQEQVLFCAPLPTVTGDDAVGHFLAAMGSLDLVADTIEHVRKAAICVTGDAIEPASHVERYQQAVGHLKTAGFTPDPAKAIQVDLHLSAPNLALDRKFVSTVAETLWALRPIMSRPAGQLSQFATEFERRYGDQHIPLLEALDEDMGVGFGGASKLRTPLVAGMSAGQAGARSQVTFRDIDAYLLGRVMEAVRDGRRELQIDDDDVKKFGGGADAFPASMAALGTLFEDEQGELGFDLSALFGPPASAILGRFCCGSPELTESVRKLIEDTEPTNDDVIVAELAHAPDGRVGNVILRPVLRSHEITYLGGSGAAPEAQIPASDLAVFCRNGVVHLESRSRGRMVVPRLTNAHNFNNPLNLPIYRFLGALQSQGEPAFGWFWGPVLTALPWLPALQFRGLRLSRERWRLYSHETKPVVDEGDEAIGRLLAARRISGPIRVKQADNYLELNLEHALDRALFREECRRNPVLELEAAPTSTALIRDGDGNRHVQEVVIPLHSSRRRHSPSRRAFRSAPEVATFGPGSEWLYARIFCGVTSQDRWLRTAFPLIAERAAAQGCAKAFFIRYTENGSHLRLRIHGPPDVLWGSVRRDLESSLGDELAERSVSRLEYATYLPEYGRYGGETGTGLCEQIFSADSLAACRALKEIADRSDKEDLRWKYGFTSVLGLVKAFDLEAGQESTLIETMRLGYWNEFGLRSAEQLNAKYRDHKRFVDDLLGGRSDGIFDSITAERNSAINRLAVDLKSALEPEEIGPIVQSLIHMSANRVFPERARLHELAILHLIQKGEAAVTARQKYQPEIVLPPRT